MAGKGRILIIDDEYLIRWSLQQNLVEHGYQAFLAASAEEGQVVLEREEPDLVLLDIQLPGMNGLEFLKLLRQNRPDCPAVMITATSDVAVAVQAMRDRACDYLPKPFNLDEVRVVVDKALENRRLKQEVAVLKASRPRESGFDVFVYRSGAMGEMLGIARKIASSETATVMLTGESGTGKDLLAQAIHRESARREMPFMPINCAALPRELLESELMGHEVGAFTDAKTLKKGLFELAQGGTILLDEIGDMDMALQSKLLRFLESRTFKRVGGTRDIMVDVRVIAATNRDLAKAISEKRFREDLFYRLNVIPIHFPPLRERKEDILLLAEHFIARFSRDLGKKIKGIGTEAREAMEAYSWPGNVRELRNVIERAMILAGDRITCKDLALKPPARGTREAAGGGEGEDAAPPTLNLEEMEMRLIGQALERTEGNQTRACELLGITRDTLRYRMKRYRLL
jgi:two-component system response regulator AtoC